MAREVRVAILGDSRDFSRAVSSAQGDARKLDGSFSGIADGAVRMGKAVAFGLAGGAVAVGVFAKSAIDAGSDLNEVISKSNTVFKEQGEEMLAWGETAATAFGQSKKQALEAASSFGNMFIQLGIGSKQAAGMSREMTELASDFASFHNADISEVLEAQQAAFRGEYDSVQKFVPTINAAAVEQKALKLGLAKTTKELTAQDKALATEALMIEGAGDAMGDFARTSDGLANKQRILTARFDDVKAKIGQGLIPVALALADFFSTKLLPAFEEIGGGVVALTSAFSDGADDVTSSGWAGALEQIGVWARNAYDDIVVMVKDGLSALADWWDDHGPKITAAVKGFAEDFDKYVLGPMAVVARFVVEELVPKFATFITWILENKGVLEALGILVGVTLVAHFATLAAAAITSAAATAAAWAAAVLPLTAMLVTLAALAAATDWIVRRPEFSKFLQWIIDMASNAWDLVRALGKVIPLFALIASMGDNVNSIIDKIKETTGIGPNEATRNPLDPKKTSRAQGGVVPGAFGQPMPIIAHGGEVVTMASARNRGGGGGVTNIFNITAIDPASAARAVKDALRGAGVRGVG